MHNNGDYEIIAVFRGASLARTMLISEKGVLKVRKEALRSESPYAFQKLQEQAEWLEKHGRLAPRVPKLLQKTLDGGFFAYDMEYYKSVSFFDYIHSKPLESSKAMLSRIIDFCYGEVYGNALEKGNRKIAEEFVQAKFYGKIKEAEAADAKLKELASFEKIFVNQNEFLNLHKIAKKITSDAETMESISKSPLAGIHGDISVDNIVCTQAGENGFQEDSFVLLDPNPSNVFNTPLVDMSKLSQSLHSGYEFLIDCEECSAFGNQIIFNDNTSSNYVLLDGFFQKSLRERLGEEGAENVLFFDALNYSRLLPLQQKLSPKTYLVYYATMVKLLNEFAKSKGLA